MNGDGDVSSSFKFDPPPPKTLITASLEAYHTYSYYIRSVKNCPNTRIVYKESRAIKYKFSIIYIYICIFQPLCMCNSHAGTRKLPLLLRHFRTRGVDDSRHSIQLHIIRLLLLLLFVRKRHTRVRYHCSMDTKFFEVSVHGINIYI